MADSSQKKSGLGLSDHQSAEATRAVDRAALGISIVWLLLSAGYFLFFSQDGLDGVRFLLILMVVFMPVAMIWVAAMAMRAARIMEAESARLQAAVDALRKAYVTQSKASSPNEQLPAVSIAKKLDEIAAAQRKTETALATFTTVRHQNPAPLASDPSDPNGGDQPALALGTPAEAIGQPLSTAQLIRALNFPETADDSEGFAALRRALKDRPTAQLVQASQDVLTLLSQDGIYMDDLRPDLARPELWRRFAQGERGRVIAALGGVRDRSSLALTNARMKKDPIFRDATHHFLRLYDKALAQFEKTASDEELADYTMTRTSRAFMLLGRVAGTFD